MSETREIVATLEARIQSLYDTIGEMKDHVDSLTRTCEDLRTHAGSLETQLKASQAAVREAAAAAALAEKSATIEQLMSERTALRFQLERESERRQALERQQQGQGHGSQHRVIEMPEL